MIAVLKVEELMNRNLIIAGLILASVTSFAGPVENTTVLIIR
jgi:hypothetical protein